MEPTSVRFGEFEFEPDSGELRRLGANGGGQTSRLAPQPARLLSLLVHKRGELVTRQEIRELLWPDVQIDFDRSLHFCVRQVRAALGDSATAPRYVENLPRRGYRLKPAVTETRAAVPTNHTTSTPTARRRWPWAAAALILAGVASAWLFLADGPASHGEPLVSIAIMSFTPPEGMSGFEDARPIAEWILADLADTAGSRAGIVGPTSTAAYDDSTISLKQLARDYGLQYVVNGRFIESEAGPRMLAELIRVSDGAHVWVRAYDDLSEGRRIGEEIGRNVARELGLE